MIGDSRIGQGNWDSLLGRNDVINRGIFGDRMFCICQRLDYLKNTTAKICFIEGGLLDLYHEEVDSILYSYQTVVEFCKQQHIIPVINLLVYIGPKATPSYKEGNAKILLVNQKLMTYAKKNNIDYIDLNPTLASEKEHLLKDEYSVDGGHFNKAAYKIWVDEINIILKKYKI